MSRFAIPLVLLVLVVAVALWRPTANIPMKALREGAHPAPDWLPAFMKKLPQVPFGPEQSEALWRDGVVALPGALKDSTVLAVLRKSWGSWEEPAMDWRSNGVLRSFVRDGPLGAVAAAALNGSAVRAFSSIIFNVPGGHPGGFVPPGPPHGGVHMDLDSHVEYVVPLVSVWIALMDGPRPLEFLRGSHVAGLGRRCPVGPYLTLEDACIAGLLRDGGERLGWDVRAGDVLVFFAQTYHWTVLHAKARTSLSLRFVGAGQRRDFQDLYLERQPCTRKPRWCQPLGSSSLFPVVHPRENSTVDAMPFPIWERQADALCRRFEPPIPEVFGSDLCGRQ
mmetsp:Transcript_134691/g.418604  ORF Transcript_134691/g.418604 Transcript_134691/m.418604 type:complete len:336 (+) Transcript_134691:53-1060(+)